jgi:8-oxo-dGTP pyrophosphatase MutT (NUDIX family)
MGASILPVTIYKGKLYFLFGKERPNDENPGWSDFGGGTDNKESYMQTAIREGGEELTGFLGSDADIKHLLTKFGTFDVDFKSTGFSVYRVHIFPMEYDPMLPHYYNNNQRFLQKRLDPKIIRDTKIFEKQQIKWFSVDDIVKHKKQFRSFYQNVVDLILAKKSEIDTFTRKSLLRNTKPSHKKTYKRTNKGRSNKSKKHRH